LGSLVKAACLYLNILIKSLKNNRSHTADNARHLNESTALTFNQTFQAHTITVHYHGALDGGGTTFGQRYSHVLAELYPGREFANCFEWCSGPAFIGFDLLSRNICENLYVSEIYEPAIASIQQTIKENAQVCQNHVFYHQAGGISDLPRDWRFDLVVGNPPHWNSESESLIGKIAFTDRLCADHNWQLHKEFFDNIRQHLNPGAVILLQESSYASGPDSFKQFVESNGMSISNCYWESDNHSFWYLEIKI